MSNNPNKVITYVPQMDEEDPTREMGRLRAGLYVYTNRLGLNYGFVLLISMIFQGFVGVFVGLKAWRLFFNWLPPEVPFQVLATLLAIAAGLLFQSALIAEAAHVVWLRRTDKIKIRLEQDSGWWRVMVIVLGVLVAVDFILLFMAMTGARDLGAAWNLSAVDQLTWFSTFALLIMNLLTLLRCASVMNTSTTELNRKAVEERTKAVAEEILIDAGDATRSEAQQVWKQLGTSPQRFIPLQDAVLNQLKAAHPDLFPAALGGDTWAYDFDGHNFTALSPNLHQSLLAARRNRHKLGEVDARYWGWSPEELAEAIGDNVQSYGKPRFVDMIDPNEPLYAYEPPANFEQAFNRRPAPAPARPGQPGRQQRQQTGAGTHITTMAEVPPALSLMSTSFTDKDGFMAALNEMPVIKMRFAGWLIESGTAAKQLNGKPFVPGIGVEVFQLFDLEEIRWYYREFVKGVN